MMTRILATSPQSTKVKSKPTVRDLKVRLPAVKIDLRDVDVTQIADVVVKLLKALLIVLLRPMDKINQESHAEAEEVPNKPIGKARSPRNQKKLPP